jgi:hypothetical protein
MELPENSALIIRVLGFTLSLVLILDFIEMSPSIDTHTGICGMCLLVILVAFVFGLLFSYRLQRIKL